MKSLIVLLIPFMCFAVNFNVNLTFTNPSNQPISQLIVKGTMFETVDPASNVQNMVMSEDVQMSLAPHETKTITVIMTCTDTGRSAPPPHTLIHPTPLTMTREGVDAGPSQTIDKAIQNARQRARLF